MSKATGIYLEFTEEEPRKPSNSTSNLVSQKLNGNFGIFGRCFYDAVVEIRLFREPETDNWAGLPHLYFKYHNGGSNGAGMMLHMLIKGTEVDVLDKMDESAQNRKKEW